MMIKEILCSFLACWLFICCNYIRADQCIRYEFHENPIQQEGNAELLVNDCRSKNSKVTGYNAELLTSYGPPTLNITFNCCSSLPCKHDLQCPFNFNCQRGRCLVADCALRDEIEIVEEENVSCLIDDDCFFRIPGDRKHWRCLTPNAPCADPLTCPGRCKRCPASFHIFNEPANNSIEFGLYNGPASSHSINESALNFLTDALGSSIAASDVLASFNSNSIENSLAGSSNNSTRSTVTAGNGITTPAPLNSSISNRNGNISSTTTPSTIVSSTVLPRRNMHHVNTTTIAPSSSSVTPGSLLYNGNSSSITTRGPPNGSSNRILTPNRINSRLPSSTLLTSNERRVELISGESSRRTTIRPTTTTIAPPLSSSLNYDRLDIPSTIAPVVEETTRRALVNRNAASHHRVRTTTTVMPTTNRIMKTTTTVSPLVEVMSERPGVNRLSNSVANNLSRAITTTIRPSTTTTTQNSNIASITATTPAPVIISTTNRPNVPRNAPARPPIRPNLALHSSVTTSAPTTTTIINSRRSNTFPPRYPSRTSTISNRIDLATNPTTTSTTTIKPPNNDINYISENFENSLNNTNNAIRLVGEVNVPLNNGIDSPSRVVTLNRRSSFATIEPTSTILNSGSSASNGTTGRSAGSAPPRTLNRGSVARAIRPTRPTIRAQPPRTRSMVSVYIPELANVNPMQPATHYANQPTDFQPGTPTISRNRRQPTPRTLSTTNRRTTRRRVNRPPEVLA